MLYTIMPWEIIFPAEPQAPLTPVTMATIHGRPCLVRREPDGILRIERLLSTDPTDFLDERFLPNTAIDLWF